MAIRWTLLRRVGSTVAVLALLAVAAPAQATPDDSGGVLTSIFHVGAEQTGAR